MTASDNAARFAQLDVKGQADPVLDALRRLEPRLMAISSLAPDGGASVLHGDVGLARKIPLSHLGDGIDRLVSMLLAVFTTPGGLVLIDEIENGFHYSTLPMVWSVLADAAASVSCQIVATTHSYDCLSAAATGLPEHHHDDFRYLRLERVVRPRGLVVSRTLDHEALSTAVERGWEVR